MTHKIPNVEMVGQASENVLSKSKTKEISNIPFDNLIKPEPSQSAQVSSARQINQLNRSQSHTQRSTEKKMPLKAKPILDTSKLPGKTESSEPINKSSKQLENNPKSVKNLETTVANEQNPENEDIQGIVGAITKLPAPQDPDSPKISTEETVVHINAGEVSLPIAAKNLISEQRSMVVEPARADVAEKLSFGEVSHKYVRPIGISKNLVRIGRQYPKYPEVSGEVGIKTTRQINNSEQKKPSLQIESPLKQSVQQSDAVTENSLKPVQNQSGPANIISKVDSKSPKVSGADLPIDTKSVKLAKPLESATVSENKPSTDGSLEPSKTFLDAERTFRFEQFGKQDPRNISATQKQVETPSNNISATESNSQTINRENATRYTRSEQTTENAIDSHSEAKPISNKTESRMGGNVAVSAKTQDIGMVVRPEKFTDPVSQVQDLRSKIVQNVAQTVDQKVAQSELSGVNQGTSQKTLDNPKITLETPAIVQVAQARNPKSRDKQGATKLKRETVKTEAPKHQTNSARSKIMLENYGSEATQRRETPVNEENPADYLKQQLRDRIEILRKAKDSMPQNSVQLQDQNLPKNLPLKDPVESGIIQKNVSTIPHPRSNPALFARSFAAEMVEKIKDLGDQLNSTKSTQKNSFTVDAGKLGSLEIEFAQEKSRDQITIYVDSDLTRTELQRVLPNIEDNLSQRGFNFAGVDVEVKGDQTESNSLSREKNQESTAKHEDSTPQEQVVSDDNKKTTKRNYGYNTMEVLA